MIKKVVLLISILMLLGCSTGDERRALVEATSGRVIFQQDPDCEGCEDVFITERNSEYFIVFVSGSGHIFRTEKLGKDKNEKN